MHKHIWLKWPSLFTTVAVILGAAVTGVATGDVLYRSATGVIATHLPARSTVVNALTRRTGVVAVLTTPGGGLRELPIATSDRVVTRDSQPLMVNSILVGDTLIAKRTGQIEDESQAQAQLNGVVAIAPDLHGGPLVLLVRPSLSVIVDTGKSSGNDLSWDRAVTGLMEADIVRVSGVLDQAAGEMTQTQTITRLRA